MLPVGSWEGLALDFQQQGLEIVQLAHGLRGGLLDHRHRLAHAAEQDGVLDRLQRYPLGLPSGGKTLVGRAEVRLHASGAEERPPDLLDVGRGLWIGDSACLAR